MSLQNKKTTILIAGASGFVGSFLIKKLLYKFPNAKIIALSRGKQISFDPGVEWRTCDLFSIESVTSAIPQEIDLAIYLVHSMAPTANLDQGSFADYDLLIADNFARRLKQTQVQQIIYLSGLIPPSKSLSLHLSSRQEVEEVFKISGIPYTLFRAGLILGESGSSFQILLKLVKRLPILICPHWTQTLTTPVDIQTVTDSIVGCSLSQSDFNKTYDLSGCQALTYMDMMRETVKKLGLHRIFLRVPFFTPTLSKLWVSLITQTPKELVYPLIESLKYPMIARTQNTYAGASPHTTYSEMIEKIDLTTKPSIPSARFKVRRNTVRSIQRCPLHPGQTAEDVQKYYFIWLKNAFKPFIKVLPMDQQIKVCLLQTKQILLQFKIENQTSTDITRLQIEGGLLVSSKNEGYFEFRSVLNDQFVLIAIHNYRPAIPWYLYKVSQARVHLAVMKRFTKALAALNGIKMRKV